MTPPFSPDHLGPDEALGRRVASTKTRSKVQAGDAPLTLFITPPHNPERHKVSVDRLLDDWLEDATGVADNYYEKNMPERNFYGWAEVSQASAGEQGRSIQLTPLSDNQYHTNIVLPDTAATREQEIEDHAIALAANAHWKPRFESPAPSDD